MLFVWDNFSFALTLDIWVITGANRCIIESLLVFSELLAVHTTVQTWMNLSFISSYWNTILLDFLGVTPNRELRFWLGYRFACWDPRSALVCRPIEAAGNVTEIGWAVLLVVRYICNWYNFLAGNYCAQIDLLGALTEMALNIRSIIQYLMLYIDMHRAWPLIKLNGGHQVLLPVRFTSLAACFFALRDEAVFVFGRHGLLSYLLLLLAGLENDLERLFAQLL